MTIIAPSGLVNLQAPLPAPRSFTLLDAAQVDQPDTDRWLGGSWIGGDVPGPAHTHDPCSSGSNRVKAAAGPISLAMAGTFTVYLPGMCTAQSVGPDPTAWTDRLKLVFQVYESAAVERVLVSGDGHSTLGSYLGDPNAEVLGGGTVDPIEGLALLEERIALNGTGLIHVTPAVATYWLSETLITASRGQLMTGLGTRVAVGAGYIGAYPDGESSPGEGEEWAWASGPIQIMRSDLFAVPTNYSEALDRTFNDVMFIAERHYLINWIARLDSSDSDHIQAGVLIDRTPGT